jgi:hypothetical protein
VTNTAWLVIIYVAALILFLLAAVEVSISKVNLIAAGLAVLTLAFMLKAAGVL